MAGPYLQVFWVVFFEYHKHLSSTLLGAPARDQGKVGNAPVSADHTCLFCHGTCGHKAHHTIWDRYETTGLHSTYGTVKKNVQRG